MAGEKLSWRRGRGKACQWISAKAKDTGLPSKVPPRLLPVFPAGTFWASTNCEGSHRFPIDSWFIEAVGRLLSKEL